MMKLDSRRLLVVSVGLVLLAGGCGGGNSPTDGGPDAGPDTGVDGGLDGSDACVGLTLCTTSGLSCSGDTLVTCAANADGCLVETRDDCAATGGSCSASGAIAACVPDPCDGVPAADQCAADGDRECSGDTLRMCAPDVAGCLVFTDTDCAAADGGACDDTGAMPMCVVPVDPCAGIADACASAGTSCTSDSLVTCAPNAFGCLVETTEDCGARAGGTCDASATPAACTFTGDPCAGVTQCTTLGSVCHGPELVTCAPDAFGCNVETRSDCTAAAFGFCDTAVDPNTCSTAATDPCLGMTTCTPAGATCSADSLVTCAPNAFGCDVETTTDCTATSEVCGDVAGVSQCGGVCDFRAPCASASYCDGMDAVACTTDADGCLVEDTRTTCASGLACTAGACAPATCPSAPVTIIDCATGSITGNTADGTMDISSYPGCTSSTRYTNAEQVFVFQNATHALVDITSTRLTGTRDYDLFVLDGSTGDLCTAASCIDSSRGTSASENVSFDAAAGGTYFVAYDLWGSTAETTDYTLDITCTPVVCGDGAIVVGAETCDDGNTDPSDGCSATCTTEPGYGCSGEPSTCVVTCGNGVLDTGETCDDGNRDPSDGCSATCTEEDGYRCSGAPSTCVPLAANASCAGATAIMADTTIAGEDITLGGPRPAGTGCGTSSGDSALYYAVTIPPSTLVNVTTTSSLDRVLLTQDACADTACTFRTDSAPEGTTLRNDTASPITRIVVIHNWSSSGTGSFDIRFTYFAPTIISETEPNEDGTPSTGGSGIVGNDFDATAISNAEANGVITSDTVINAALSPAGDEDVFAIQNTTGAPITVTIETGSPTIGACSDDTGLRLRAADLTTVMTDDDGGPGTCSRIVYTIPAGVTYYAQVVGYGDNSVIDPYQLSIDFP